jgi:zinc protease
MSLDISESTLGRTAPRTCASAGLDLPRLTTLPNGLRVAVHPTTTAPLAAVYLWLDTGSADEAPRQIGAAHMLEHMVFKGTARHGLGEAAGRIEGVGGDLNAFTSLEETVLHATVEASACADALDVLADMARFPLLDPDEYERERQVVLEEIRGYEADPESVLEDQLMARLFSRHGYGRSITGRLEQVQNLALDDVRSYWQRWSPNHTVLGVAGDIESGDVVAMAHRLLGAWAPANRSSNRRFTRPSARQPYVAAIDRDFDTTAVQMGWRSVPIGHPDAPALDVLAAALGDGAASLLTRRLQLEDELATDAWGSSSLHASAGGLLVGFLPREGATTRAIRGALAVVEATRSQPLDATTVARSRDGILADMLFETETVDGIAHDLCFYTCRYGAPEARDRYQDGLRGVQATDVARVARRWLGRENFALAAVDGAVSARQLRDAASRGRAAPGLPSAAQRSRRIAIASPSTRSAPMRGVLNNGTTLHIVPDDTGVAAVHVVGLGGRLFESSGTSGIGEAWSSLVTSSAAGLTVEAFGEAIDDIAASLSATSSRSTLRLRASFPASCLDAGIDLIGACVAAPGFDGEEWERIREELIEEVHTRPDRASEVASDAVWAALYPRHAWALPSVGAEAALCELTPAAIRQWHTDQLVGDNLVVAVTGGIDARRAWPRLAEWLEQLPPTGRPLPAPPTEPMLHGARRMTAGREQVHMVLATRAPTLSDPDRIDHTVLATLLGSQGGRLFMALRERESLGYEVWARNRPIWMGGVFQVGVATDPSRAAEARAALLREVEHIANEPPSTDELDRVRRMLVGMRAMALQRASGRAASIATSDRLGLSGTLESLVATLAEVTAQDVAEAARGLLRTGFATIEVQPRLQPAAP